MSHNAKLHIVTSSDEFVLSLWALASWYLVSGRHDRLCIHDDGTLLDFHCSIFRRLFTGSRSIRRSLADSQLIEVLNGQPLTIAFRVGCLPALKLLDFPALSRQATVLSWIRMS